MQTYLTEVTAIKYLTANIVELHVRLVPPEPMAFTAGQFMQFDCNGTWRSYSITSVPTGTDVTLTFCVKLIPEGVGSTFVRGLEVGGSVTMRGPLGVFAVKEIDFNRNLCFVATGVGIAPFYSMIPDLLTRGYVHAVTLVFGVRSEEDVFYFDKFSSLEKLHPNFGFIPMLSQPKSHWPGETGRVTTYVDSAFERFSDRLFYLCGSQEMVTNMRALLLKKGHHAHDIHLEIF